MTPSIPPPVLPGSHTPRGSSSDMSQPSEVTGNTHDDGSDYGEFTLEEQEIINELLSNVAPGGSIAEEPPLKLTDIEDYEEPKGVRLPKILGKEQWTPPWMRQQPRALAATQSTIEHQTSHDLSTGSVDSAAEEKRAQHQRSASIEPQPDTSNPDTRSPIERFRTKPKKALSVTDLVSPAWCELQYFYSLSKHGKKRATPAMRQGTKVHKKLEDEVHTTVPVSITTKEDSWGLRIWNVVQGLRTLRETGKTRELEVWGVIDGQVVNGVIDELSYECPDPGFEEQESRRRASAQDGKVETPGDQPSIMEYLLSSAGGNGKTFSQLGTGLENSMQPPPQPPSGSKKWPPGLDEKKIYITDMKTRTVKSLPSALAARPTEVQLQLYHSMLTSLAQGNVPLSVFAERYSFNPSVPFSDSFIAQVGSLNEQFFDAISSQSQGEQAAADASSNIPASSQDSIDILLKHNSIASLWKLMIEQFQQIFLLSSPPSPPPPSPPSSSQLPPRPSSSSPSPDLPLPTRLSPLLTATYIHPSLSTETTPIHLGNKTFIHSPTDLAAYIADEMAWWRGERKVRGVEIHEVNSKCTRCEFLPECEWVKERERGVWERVVGRREKGGRGKGA